MFTQHGKRALSLFLAIIMIFSALPVQAFAAEEEYVPQEENIAVTSEPTEDPTALDESEALIALRAEIAAYIEKLGITPDMPDQMLLYAYGNHESYEAAQESLTKQDEFWEKGKLLSEAEQQILLDEPNSKLCLRYREVAENAYGMMTSAECTVNGVKFATTSTNSNVSASGTTVTATVKGNDGGCDDDTPNTMTLYVTNTSSEAGAVSFNMTQTNINSIKVGNEDIKGRTSYSKALEAGGEFIITVTTGANTTENKLELTDITFTSANASFTVTVEYPNAHGSVTASVTGTSVDADGTTTMTIPEITAAEGVTLTANSSSFLCWVDKDNKFLSKDKVYTVNPSADTTVKPVMTGGNAHFQVNGNLVYGDLNEAVKMVATASNKTIVLMNNGTLPAGDYTIPSGVTLLIPFDDANTLYTSEPASVDASGTPTAYRTLTMESGANITIDGALSLSAKHSNKQLHNGRPVGAISFINMKSNSKITVNSGGNLYVWGYITGDGSVEVKKGATVYENFQVMDWRGGTAGTGMIGNKNRVFLMSQYYIQNVEVPMTIHAGASERAYMSVTLPIVGAVGSNVPFIGTSNCMFTISDGYIIKDYREGTGRLDIDVYGDISVSGIKISLSFYSVNSADYELPLNGNLTIDVHSGNINLNQNIAFQPGSELYIREDAVCNLGSNNSIYVYDQDNWGPYVYNDGSQYKNLPYIPGGGGTEGRGKDALIQIDGKAVLNGTAYTTAAGANIISSGNGVIEIGKIGKQTVTYQAKQNGTDISYAAIDVTPVKLMNADDTYIETADAAGKVIYKFIDGTWTCEHTYAEGTYSEEVTTAATCLAAGVKTITCHCGDTSAFKTETIEQLDHVYEAVVTAPTCIEVGYTTYTCKNGCNDSYTDSETAALGHTEETLAAKAPTCTETGLTEGKKCSVCGETLVAQEEVAALGHTEESIAAVAPDCTNTGLTEGKKCSVCGETLVAQEVVDALGHTEETLAAVAPDCTNTGLTEGKKCSVCGEILVAQEEVSVLGHTWEWIIDQDATVLNPGSKHEECSVCHEKRNENTEIPVLNCSHTGTMVITEAKPATCIESGNSRYGYCSACQNYYSDDAGQHEIEKDSWVIAALDHDEVEHEAQAPTCTEIGWDAYVTCSRCDYSTYAEKIALGHYETEHMAKAPTCTEAGWNAYVTCLRCDYTTKEEVPAKGHGVLEEVAAVASTCQKEGIVAHWHCPDCGMNFADEAAVNKLDSIAAPIDPENHTWADEGEVETKATCKAEGKLVFACENDGCNESKDEILPIDPEGHIWDEGEPFGNHNCNSASYTKYTCTLCKEENLVVVREQHFRIPIAEEIPATCTQDGMTSGWKCEKCDEFWIPQEVIPALGHDWNEKFPCQNDTSACTRCDLHFDTKQEHLIVVDPEVPATCTEPGLSEGSHCGYCGQILVAQNEVPVTDHNWIVADMEIPATCGVPGHREGASYCLDCNYDADPIPALEHEWMHREAKKATYSAIGWNAHDYCLMCKATKTTEQYENHPCEFCGEDTEGYIEIPMVEIQRNETLEEFLRNIGYLEMMAAQYAVEHPSADPLGLVLNYMRTAVPNYTTGSWAIMAGPEDQDFLKYVQEMEDTINADPSIQVWVNVSGLKKLDSYKSPSNENNPYTGTFVSIMSGHFFGTMDMTYHNKDSQNHADVGGWVGDLVDLLSTADELGVDPSLTLEEKIAYIHETYLFKTNVAGSAGSFGHNDLYADLEAYYFMNELITKGYETGDLEKLMRAYFRPGLTLEQRVSYLLNNRLDALSTRQDLRTAVYNAYTSNKLIATLEGTRNFNASGSELSELRKAVCYAFADEMCRIAGDYVEDLTNPRFTVFDTETKILAPGISQQINYATNADGKQIVYYVATADVKRDDVGMWVNYYDRDPGTPENPVWKNNSVPSSAQNAQDRYGDPASEDYIENFNVIASTNAGGYSMQDDATPGGLIVMNGVEWYPQSGSAGFFAILDDGTAYMGTAAEYETMKDRIQEAIGGFGEFVVQDGKVTGSAAASDAPRTSVGITSTGRVVIMCIDGRQAPFSSGASLQDVGYIMKEAGCIVAINLDGGGSTTFVARQPGSDELTIMNRPSDGYPRNVSSNLLLYSTAPSSTAFDHAVIESEYDYATINTPVQMTAAGVSPSGNAVDIPEGAVWAVSDENWGSITADGVFTGKRMGEVTVYLMLDGKEIGSKLMTMTNPDQLYFEKTKVDAIYGSSVNLPLRARTGGKPIAINPDDVSFTLSAPAAGTMDGFTFQAAESEIKTLSITAAINETAKASINVMLYKQGENSFDFDKATGGDRMLAWDRQVSNAKVEDDNIYNVIDPSEDMVTSYTFALDMTAIPIPARLEELTYMLPGGTMEGANAWSFLLSLAQRISDLTWVQATVDIDDRFDVDYSNLKILNDYFELKNTEFDETTNTLTVTMNWIKQSQVIDEATANPLCLINGIKLTPKEGVWNDVTKIDVVTTGTIGYEIYMRASGLYSFAQKPENQAVFGLYPYRNPADTTDAGGYFRDTYAEITDEYTLVNVLKEGWVNEDGGFAYYVEGERLTGIQEIDGSYYDFGENGINVGQSKFTGLFYDDAAGVYRYSYIGTLASGWQFINNEWYFFKSSTMAAATGAVKMYGVVYEFEETGKLISGVWGNTLHGMRYYYGPSYYEKYWQEIDGELYYFKDGYRLTGIQLVRSQENSAAKKWYDFGEDGICRDVEDGLYTHTDGNIYYIIDGFNQIGLQKVVDDYYFFAYAGNAVCNRSYYAWETHCDLPCSTYYFGPDGKMINGLVQAEDGVYYYVNGKVASDAAGLTKIGDDYYFISSIGRCATGKYYAWATNCDLPCGNYEFGPDGKMLQGVVEKEDGHYYYINGKLAASAAGLTKIGDDYYFVASNGRTATGSYYCWATNCELPCSTYEFAADGKMLQGIVEKADGNYYYINGKPATKAPGLTKVGDDYYFVASNGRVATGSYYCWATNCELPCSTYEFAADGKMLQDIVEKADGNYYYINGKPATNAAGLTKVGDDYYFVASNGRVATGSYYAWATNCDLPCSTYEFGADGKMLHGFVQKDESVYCYVYGKLGGSAAGLTKIGDDYYFVTTSGKCATGKYNAWATNCDLPTGTYEFGADGKMLNGFVTKADGIYYYENGKTGRVGLNYIDGYYYFVSTSGRLVVNQDFYVWETNGLLIETTYKFNELGQIIG